MRSRLLATTALSYSTTSSPTTSVMSRLRIVLLTNGKSSGNALFRSSRPSDVSTKTSDEPLVPYSRSTMLRGVPSSRGRSKRSAANLPTGMRTLILACSAIVSPSPPKRSSYAANASSMERNTRPSPGRPSNISDR